MKRPPSYSEGCIHNLNIPLIDDIYSINKYKPLDENIKIEVIVSNPVKNNYGEIILNKVCSFTFHLLLIASFEIIFFNFFILSYETNSIISLVDQISVPIVNSCSTLSNSSKVIIDNYINTIINQTVINNNALQDYTQRLLVNNLIFYKSIYYLIGIVIFLIGVITSNYYYFKRQIQFRVIIIDNIIMILILGIYEYIFFKNIVFKYQIIYPNELIKNLIQNILYNC